MISVYQLKPRFQQLLRPLAAALVKAKVTPNAVTVSAIIGSAVCGGVAALGAAQHPLWLLVLPVWLFSRMALNAIDGLMAREFNLTSNLGAILNELGDALSDLALYLPLALVDPAALWPIILFSVGAVLTEFCGVLGKALGVSRHYEGPMGKSDRALVVGALAVATAFFPAALVAWKWVFWAGVLLAAWTCRNRLAGMLAECRTKH
jgi:phosphatidylglycerophosphate synthase